MKWFKVLLFFGCLSAHLTAQMNISGFISDAETQEPLIGATVIFMGDFTIGSTTDNDGEFKISIPKPEGTTELLIQYIGYEEQIIAVSPSQTSRLDILLNHSAVSIEEVTVTATPTLGEEFVVTEILKLDIYTNPNARADPLRAVNSLPASTSVDESANLSLRGSPPGETGYVLNRVPINDVFKLDQSNGVGQFSIFNTSIINKVDVYPSNPPLEYGGSSSGLIALYTDDIGSASARSVSVTLAGAGLKVDQRINNKNGIAAYANYSLNNGLKTFNKKAFENLKSFNSFDAGVYWVSTINNRTKLKVFNYALNESYGYQVDQPSYEGVSLQEKSRNQTVINLEKKIGQYSNLDFNQGINFSKGEYDYGNTSHLLKKKDYFSSLNFSRFDDFFSFGLGVSVNMHFVDNEGKYPEYFWALANQHPTLGYNNSESFIIPELYTYQKFRFSENFVFGISDRRTVAPSDNVGEFKSNQINLSYLHDASHSLKASIGKYHKLIVPGEQFYEANLVSSRHYSLDYSYKKENFDLSAAVYHKKTKYGTRDLHIVGAELFGGFENDMVKTSLSVAHVKAEVQTPEIDYPSRNDLNIFIRHLLKYKLGTHLEFNSVLFLRSGSYFDPVLSASYHEPTQSYQPSYSSIRERDRLPNYSLWDLSISKLSQVGDGVLILFVSASNVLDKKNVRGPRYDEAYQQIGNEYFGRRVFFMGAVYNWDQ